MEKDDRTGVGASQPEINRLTPHVSAVIDELRKVMVDRGGSYSDFRDNAKVMIDGMRASGLSVREDWPEWSQAALIYIHGKISRISMPGGVFHRDSWLDCAGYAILAVSIIDAEKVNVKNGIN